MARDDPLRFRPADLEAFAAAVLGAAGVTQPHRDDIAAALVRADLRGVDSHGIARLEPYAEHFEAGGFDPDPEMSFEQRAPGALVVDADGGPGQSAGTQTMERLVSMAREAGVAAGVVRNSNHFGTAARYAELAADADCIGVAATNAPAEVVPYGATERYLGTNPLAVSVPTGGETPITLDMATSVVAMGKVAHVAAETGQRVPGHWALDEAGDPTTDPEAVHALRPLGGHKGYGLAVVVEVLAGLLSGAGRSVDLGPLYDDFDEPMGVGHFFLALDVASFRDLAAFADDVDRFVEGLKAVRTGEDTTEVLLPGEPEARAMAENRERGVPVNRGVVETLRDLADRYGVALPDPVEE